jgi:hypothetical protein
MVTALDTPHRPPVWQGTPGRPTWGIVAGDVLRLAALGSVVVGGMLFGPVAVALFLLVAGATMVPRALGARTALDLTCCGSALAAAWFAQLDTYRAVPGLDLVVHAVTTAAVAVLAHQVLVRFRLAVTPGESRGAAALEIVGLGAVVAVVWEFLEAAGHLFVDDRIYVTYTDTIGDLAAGLAGSVLAAVLVTRSSHRADATGGRA